MVYYSYVLLVSIPCFVPETETNEDMISRALAAKQRSQDGRDPFFRHEINFVDFKFD